MDNVLRIEHFEKLLGYVEERSRYTDDNFDLLYRKLKDELNQEYLRLDDPRKNLYLNNLKQTIVKQAQSFQEAKQKDKSRDFEEFVQALMQDIQDELTRTKRPFLGVE
jgi:hypothetical protein